MTRVGNRAVRDTPGAEKGCSSARREWQVDSVTFCDEPSNDRRSGDTNQKINPGANKTLAQREGGLSLPRLYRPPSILEQSWFPSLRPETVEGDPGPDEGTNRNSPRTMGEADLRMIRRLRPRDPSGSMWLQPGATSGSTGWQGEKKVTFRFMIFHSKHSKDGASL